MNHTFKTDPQLRARYPSGDPRERYPVPWHKPHGGEEQQWDSVGFMPKFPDKVSYKETAQRLRLLQLTGDLNLFSDRLKKTFTLIINDDKAIPKIQRNLLLLQIGDSTCVDENVVDAFLIFRQKGKLSDTVLLELNKLYRNSVDSNVKHVFTIIMDMIYDTKSENIENDNDTALLLK